MQMKLLQERIVKDGQIEAGNILKVDSFLNHQIDVSLLEELGKEFHRQFAGQTVNKILTIEASGIAIACIAARYFQVPVVFAEMCTRQRWNPSHTRTPTISSSPKSFCPPETAF